MQGTGRKHLLLVDPEGVVRSTSAIPYSSDKPRLTDMTTISHFPGRGTERLRV